MNTDIKMMVYIDGMAGRPSKKKPSKIGARVAALRKQAGFSQAQLAKLLGMPQRTLSYYEREASDIPTKLVTDLSKILGVPISLFLQGDNEPKSKRGPKSKIERQVEKIERLPRSRQQFVSQVLDQLLAAEKTS